MYSFGSVFEVSTMVPVNVDGLPGKFDLILTLPCVYQQDGTPSDLSDYMNIVFVRSDHVSSSDVLEMLRAFGARSARWITDFWKVESKDGR